MSATHGLLGMSTIGTLVLVVLLPSQTQWHGSIEVFSFFYLSSVYKQLKNCQGTAASSYKMWKGTENDSMNRITQSFHGKKLVADSTGSQKMLSSPALSILELRVASQLKDCLKTF
jgi:hypothetical protein